jgi:ABC-type antimicrobial peptide transport system permease subunit
VFASVLRRLALGVGAGSLVSALVMTTAELDATLVASLLLAVAAIMMTVGLLAAWGPARRALRIPPVEALRIDL